VHPIAFKSDSKNQSQALRDVEDVLTGLKLVAKGDLVVITIGEAIGQSGNTNTMKIVKVGDHHKH